MLLIWLAEQQEGANGVPSTAIASHTDSRIITVQREDDDRVTCQRVASRRIECQREDSVRITV